MKIRLFSRWWREPLTPSHGPQVWAGRFPVAFMLVRTDVWPPSTGWRLWVYTPAPRGDDRPTHGRYVELFIDRRECLRSAD